MDSIVSKFSVCGKGCFSAEILIPTDLTHNETASASSGPVGVYCLVVVADMCKVKFAYVPD